MRSTYRSGREILVLFEFTIHSGKVEVYISLKNTFKKVSPPLLEMMG